MPIALEYMEFDTATLPHEAQFAAWGSALAAYTTSTRFPERGFEARVRVWLLAQVVVTESWLGPVRYQRTREAALRDGLDSLTFQLLLSGRTRGVADGGAFRAGPGDVAVQDAALPLDATATRTGSVTVTMPRTFLDEAAPGLDVHGMVLRDGLGALLAAFLRSLPSALDRAEPDATSAVPRLLRDLLAAALPAQAALVEENKRVRPLRDRVRRHVAANLATPLTADAIAAAVGVSRAGLYRAFGDKGGVMAYVLEQRLTRARRMLSDPSRSSSVAEAATANGFRDASDLGRSFRRRFGITPGDARRGDPPRAPAAGSVEAKFRSWTDESA